MAEGVEAVVDTLAVGEAAEISIIQAEVDVIMGNRMAMFKAIIKEEEAEEVAAGDITKATIKAMETSIKEDTEEEAGAEDIGEEEVRMTE